MKRIVICCDGTWNRSDQKFATNVVKLRNALKLTSSQGVKQMPYYLDGVGTKSWVDKLPGGVFGSGLWENVQKAYQHLVEYYEPDDEIYLFGFSRGAYTARSVVGMVRKCGILKRDQIGRSRARTTSTATATLSPRIRRRWTSACVARSLCQRRNLASRTCLQ